VRSGTQGLTFNRRSTVSLAGGWGELRLGRDYTPQFWNLTTFDPFGTNGVGTTQALNGTALAAAAGGLAAGATLPGSIYTTQVRASNSIGYFLPGNLGGFYGQVQMYLGENPDTAGATEDDGNGLAFRVGYAAGPLNVALAASRTEYASVGDLDTYNIGGQWDFGVAKLMAHLNRDRADGGATGSVRGTGWLVGGLVPVGAGEIRVSYSQYELDLAATDPRSRKIAVGYVHNLSKRTAVYTTYARVRNNGGATASVFPGAISGAAGFTSANSSSSGFDLGVRHSF
jgi:predicted porin